VLGERPEWEGEPPPAPERAKPATPPRDEPGEAGLPPRDDRPDPPAGDRLF
jgi:hypothetical protein